MFLFHRAKIFLLVILLAAMPARAQETSTIDVIPDLTDNSRAILNDQIRKTSRRLNEVGLYYLPITTFTNALDASTGHDHDGTDSKKVLSTNLDMTGITNGHFLYNNNGTPAGQSKPISAYCSNALEAEDTGSIANGVWTDVADHTDWEFVFYKKEQTTLLVNFWALGTTAPNFQARIYVDATHVSAGNAVTNSYTEEEHTVDISDLADNDWYSFKIQGYQTSGGPDSLKTKLVRFCLY